MKSIFAVSVIAMSTLACVAPNADQDTGEDAQLDDELTSASALSRTLTFKGMVYVSPTASDSEVLYAVRRQTQTAFGALRTAQIGVNSRELKDVSPTDFVKTKVVVVDDAGHALQMTRVTYTYKDNAVVPKSFARKTSIALALMGQGYTSQTDRILTECTDNDDEAREFQSSIWYVFNPSLTGCKAAIAAERKAIAAANEKLLAGQVSRKEVDRLYLPVTIKLGADKTNKGQTYPEYDRLWSGGVKKDTLVLGLVNGMLDHGAASDPTADSGFGEWMDTLEQVFAARPGLKLSKIEPAEDLTKVTVNGKTYTGLSFDSLLAMQQNSTGYPAGASYSDRQAIKAALGAKVYKHWLTFSAPLTVKIGTAAPKSVSLELLTYFGAESDSSPHKFGIKNSDVFVYNGHSYIGYGPLDPSRFTASDFPSSYQILFIDGCVSYNYYEKDYLPLKPGGTKNLELITNGLEAPSWRSGWALGKFLGRLVDGKQASYLDLLNAASATDSLRVVDGEVDNQYSPTKSPITITQ